MSNTWGIGGEKFKTRKVKDHDHNERLHREAVERRKQIAAENSARAVEHNQKLHLEAEARKVEAARQRQESGRAFEWGGKLYPIDGKSPIRPTKGRNR